MNNNPHIGLHLFILSTTAKYREFNSLQMYDKEVVTSNEPS
jgi:hypothetical protein